MRMLLRDKIDFSEASSFRDDFDGLEIELGHVPSYDEEQESELVVTQIK